jgi:hypothetical protein
MTRTNLDVVPDEGWTPVAPALRSSPLTSVLFTFGLDVAGLGLPGPGAQRQRCCRVPAWCAARRMAGQADGFAAARGRRGGPPRRWCSWRALLCGGAGDGEDGKDKAHLRQGFVQAARYAHDYGLPAGYLVVFNLTEQALVFPSDREDRWPASLTIGDRTIYGVVIDANPNRPSASKDRQVRHELSRTDLLGDSQ